MPVNVIGTLKPKNNGKFPVAEAVDIKVTDNLRLDKALENKADLSTVNFALNQKAEKTTTESLQGQINQIAQAAGTGSADTEVAQARVDADGVTYTTLKARIDADQIKIKEISESPNLLGCTDPIDKTQNGIHETFDNSIITLDGTASAGTSLITYFGGRIPTPEISDGDTVTLSCRVASGSITGYIYCSLNNVEGTMFRLDVKDSVTFTWDSNKHIAFTLYINEGASFNSVLLQVQLEKGDIATPFIEYGNHRVYDENARTDILELQQETETAKENITELQNNVNGAIVPITTIPLIVETGALDTNTGFAGQSALNLISTDYIPIKGRAYYTVSWKSDIEILCKLHFYGYNIANGRVDNTNWLENETKIRSFKDYTQYALIEFKSISGDPLSLSDISSITITGTFDDKKTVNVQDWIEGMQKKSRMQSGEFIEGFHSPVGVSSITVIKDWIYLFTYNTDDTHTETITGYKYRLDSFGKITGEYRTFTFNVGHANTVDYCEATDTLIVGNGGNSSNTQPNQIFIFPNASTLSNFDVSSENCITIDVSQEGWGKQLNVVWGDDSFSNHNIIYCLTNYQQGAMEAYDENNVDEFEGESKRFIRKVLLGMSNTNTYDGTYEVLETYEYEFDESESNNDTCFHNGKIYESIVKRADGFPYIETSFENFGKNIKRGKKIIPLYRSNGAVISTEFEGMCIYSGIMYVANGNNIYLIKE